MLSVPLLPLSVSIIYFHTKPYVCGVELKNEHWCQKWDYDEIGRDNMDYTSCNDRADVSDAGYLEGSSTSYGNTKSGAVTNVYSGERCKRKQRSCKSNVSPISPI